MKADNLQFFWTVASGSSHKALKKAQSDDDYPDPESTMVSFATKENEPWPGPDWFIDSGGYSTMSSTGEYEESIDDYVQYLAENEARDDVEIDRWALRDWACEKDILREYGRSERVHQNWTIRDHFEALERAEDVGLDADPVVVLQGYTSQEYLEHIDRLQDYGLLSVSDYVAIGSVCRRNAEEEIRSTILQVRDALPSRKKIHAFGVKKTVLELPDVVAALDSVDTAAWDSKAYYRAVSNASQGDENRYTWDNVREAYVGYRDSIVDVLANADDSRSLQIMSFDDFSSGDVDAADPLPLVKCPCGQLVDFAYPDLHTAKCRKCQRLQLTLWDRRMDPDDDLFDQDAERDDVDSETPPVPSQ